MVDTNSASGSPPPALNREGLLDRLMGDEELASELVEDFLQDAPEQIRALNELVAGADATGAERCAHFLKGAAAAVGAEALWEVARELENAAKAGALDVLEARAAILEAELERLKKAVREDA